MAHRQTNDRDGPHRGIDGRRGKVPPIVLRVRALHGSIAVAVLVKSSSCWARMQGVLRRADLTDIFFSRGGAGGFGNSQAVWPWQSRKRSPRGLRPDGRAQMSHRSQAACGRGAGSLYPQSPATNRDADGETSLPPTVSVRSRGDDIEVPTFGFISGAGYNAEKADFTRARRNDRPRRRRGWLAVSSPHSRALWQRRPTIRRRAILMGEVRGEAATPVACRVSRCLRESSASSRQTPLYGEGPSRRVGSIPFESERRFAVSFNRHE